MILIDTGPLVALFDPRDQDNKNCHKVLSTIKETLYTTEAVLTESLYMLDQNSKGADALKEFILKNYLVIESMNYELFKRSFELMDKYSDQPMDFADATLVVLAEKYRTDIVFTLDFSDFRAYKYLKGHRHYSFKLLGDNLLE